MRLLWLPEVLRAAGLTVHEVSGWRTRGAESFGPVRGITIHETRGSRTSTDAGEINTLIHGSATAPPPIAPLYLSRTGHWHVVASGTCNHNRVGWAGPNKGYGNDSLLGIEAQHALGEPWTDRQYDSYVIGTAALARKLSVPVGQIAGHKEHQPAGYGHASSKTDPSFDMGKFRAAVSARLAGKDDDVSVENVEQGLYLALMEAANPAPGEEGKRGRQTRDAIRAIIGIEATSPAEMREILTSQPVDRLAAALAPLLPGGAVSDEQLERALRKAFATFGAGG